MAAAVKVDSNPKIVPSSPGKSPSVASKSKIQTTDIQNPQVSMNPTEISSTGNFSCNIRSFQVYESTFTLMGRWVEPGPFVFKGVYFPGVAYNQLVNTNVFKTT